MNLKLYLQISFYLQLAIIVIQFLNVQLHLNILDFIIPFFIINALALLVLSIITLIKKENLILGIISLIVSSLSILLIYLIIMALKTFT